jgi:hypothetical protein
MVAGRPIKIDLSILSFKWYFANRVDLHASFIQTVLTTAALCMVPHSGQVKFVIREPVSVSVSLIIILRIKKLRIKSKDNKRQAAINRILLPFYVDS